MIPSTTNHTVINTNLTTRLDRQSVLLRQSVKSPVNSSVSLKASAGFTLIEVLMALAIGAGLALLITQSITSATHITERVTEVSQRHQSINRVWQIISDDLQHAVSRPWVDSLGNTQTALSGTLGERLSQSQLLSIEDDSHLLRLVRSGERSFLPSARSNMQVVSYRIASNDNESEDESLGNTDDEESVTLWRDAWRTIDNSGEPKIRSRRLLDKLKKIQFRYLASSASESNDQAWVNGWPESSTDQDTLPVAVEVALDIVGFGEITRVFLLVSAGEVKPQ